MAQVGKERKVPQRKCIACSERGDKKQLMRIVKNKDGEVFMDPTGKANGRGAYLKKDLKVLEKAKQNKILERKLECQIPDEVYEEIRKICEK